jgi:hypothetical protein
MSLQQQTSKGQIPLLVPYIDPNCIHFLNWQEPTGEPLNIAAAGYLINWDVGMIAWGAKCLPTPVIF